MEDADIIKSHREEVSPLQKVLCAEQKSGIASSQAPPPLRAGSVQGQLCPLGHPWSSLGSACQEGILGLGPEEPSSPPLPQELPHTASPNPRFHHPQLTWHPSWQGPLPAVPTSESAFPQSAPLPLGLRTTSQALQSPCLLCRLGHPMLTSILTLSAGVDGAIHFIFIPP